MIKVYPGAIIIFTRKPFEGEEWSRLQDYNKLRNRLAHTDGRLTKEKADTHLVTYVERHKYLELDWEGNVLIHQGFCEEVVDTAVRFFREFPPGVG